MHQVKSGIAPQSKHEHFFSPAHDLCMPLDYIGKGLLYGGG